MEAIYQATQSAQPPSCYLDQLHFTHFTHVIHSCAFNILSLSLVATCCTRSPVNQSVHLPQAQSAVQHMSFRASTSHELAAASQRGQGALQSSCRYPGIQGLSPSYLSKQTSKQVCNLHKPHRREKLLSLADLQISLWSAEGRAVFAMAIL